MIIQSPFLVLGEVEVPDESRIEIEKNSMCVYVKGLNDVEYKLLEDSSFSDGTRPCRRWYDEKRRLHRDENLGPALICQYTKTYFKHGDRHRIAGPAFYTAVNTEIYCLNNKELNRNLWEYCVKYNNGKLPKKPKIDIMSLRSKCAEASVEAKKIPRVGGITIEEHELVELDVASIPKNWKKHSELDLLPNGNFKICMNCEPLDDTLRCYICLDKDGNILAARLSVE